MLPALSPVRAANAKFANLINVLAGSITPAPVPFEPVVSKSDTSNVIADAMIRSMLGTPVQAPTVSTAPTAAAPTLTNALFRSIFGTPSQPASPSAVLSQQLENEPASPATTPRAPAESFNQATLPLSIQQPVETPDRNDATTDLESQNSAKQPSSGTSKRPAKSASSTTDTLDTTTLKFPSLTVTTTAPQPVAVAENTEKPNLVQDSLPREQQSPLPKDTAVQAPETTAVPPAEIAFAVRITPVQISGPDTDDLHAAQNDPSVPSPTPAPATPATINPPATIPATVVTPIQPETNPEPAAPATGPVNKPIQAARPAATTLKTPANVDREDTPTPVVRVAAASAISNSSDFTRAFFAAGPVNNDEPRASVETETPAPLNTVAESLRTSEPAAAATSPTPATPLQSITIRVAPPEAPAVDLHVSERAGEIHVAVRTPDAALQTSLRQDLGTLTNSLERAGYRAETYVPRETQAQLATSPQAGTSNERQQQGSSGRGSGGNYPNGRQPQQQQQERDQRRKTWLQELENLK